jgi:lipopolysaccharide export LptBFGC system permease protein LptF
MLWVVIRYLRDERDEYQRMLVVRSLLCAAFAILALSAYTDFLRSYGNLPALPPFTEFVAFWIVFGFAQAFQSIGGQSDE